MVAARRLLRNGQVEAAAAALEKILEDSPQGFWPSFCMGECLFRRARFAEAAQVYGHCISDSPHIPEPYLHRARAWAALGRTRSALADFAKALEMRPNMAEGYLHRGWFHYQQQRLDEAWRDLTKAQALGAEPFIVARQATLGLWGPWGHAVLAGNLDTVVRPHVTPSAETVRMIVRKTEH